MTRDEAEEVYVAWQCGLEFDKAKIALALLTLGNDVETIKSEP